MLLVVFVLLFRGMFLWWKSNIDAYLGSQAASQVAEQTGSRTGHTMTHTHI